MDDWAGFRSGHWVWAWNTSCIISAVWLTSVNKFWVKSRKAVWGAGIRLGSPSKASLVISIDLGMTGSWARDREGPLLNFSNSSFFGISFPFKEAFSIKCLSPVSVDFQDYRIQRQYDIRERVWKLKLGTLASRASYVTYTSWPRASNWPYVRLSASANGE